MKNSFKRIWADIVQKCISMQMLFAVLFLTFIFLMNVYDTATGTSLLYEILSNGLKLDDHGSSLLFQLYAVARTNQALAYFAPAALGIVMAGSFCDEWNSRFIAFKFARMDKKVYLKELVLQTVMISCIMTILAYVLFAMIVSVFLHTPKDYEEYMQVLIYNIVTGSRAEGATDILAWKMFLGIVIAVAMLLVYMAITGLFVMLVAAISKNMYITLCLPCYVYYILGTISRRIFFVLGKDWGAYFEPGILYAWNQNMISYIALCVFLFLLISGLFYMLMERGVDKCEG